MSTLILDYSTVEGDKAFDAGTPAIYVNAPFAAYLRHPGISRSSLLTVLNETLAHYKHEQDHPDHEVSEAFLWGSAVHCHLQEPAEFAKRYRRGPVNDKTGEQYGVATKAWAEASADANRDGLVMFRDAWHLDEMCAAILRHPDTKRILDGKPLIEATIVWRDPETGLTCKGRIDNLNFAAGLFVDVKTTESAHPRKFAGSAADYGYFDQVAHYAMGLLALTGREFDGYLIPVEKKAPHAVGCYRVGGEDLEAGRDRVRWALGQIAKARQTGEYPGYREADLYAPAWYLQSLEGRMARDAGTDKSKDTSEPYWMGSPESAPSWMGVEP